MLVANFLKVQMVIIIVKIVMIMINVENAILKIQILKGHINQDNEGNKMTSGMKNLG